MVKKTKGVQIYYIFLNEHLFEGSYHKQIMSRIFPAIETISLNIYISLQLISIFKEDFDRRVKYWKSVFNLGPCHPPFPLSLMVLSSLFSLFISL